MDEFRSRPRGNFIREANWAELYVLTKHWKNDLEFYREDLRFLNKLIDKYFIWVTIEENASGITNVAAKLKELRTKCRDLLARIEQHISRLAVLVEKEEEPNSRLFRLEHEHLEEEIAGFVKMFRKSRKEVLSVTENIIGTEQLPGLQEN